ncbi:hypothetical protein SAMN04488097_2385 [Epilithonimonas lactis]|nr:hypothetical protein SAMN04488097_2385 [Epilithonimonas lactis]
MNDDRWLLKFFICQFEALEDLHRLTEIKNPFRVLNSERVIIRRFIFFYSVSKYAFQPSFL